MPGPGFGIGRSGCPRRRLRQRLYLTPTLVPAPEAGACDFEVASLCERGLCKGSATTRDAVRFQCYQGAHIHSHQSDTDTR